ncbi:extracellular solute-binding protein [Paralimibaculum aggregatum]|nr:extracellular solute-binding protein [Limibaculum sp. NKW23]
MDWTRRDLGKLSVGAGMAALLPPALPRRAAAEDTVIAHGVSAFGDLKYPAGFERFAYATPGAPIGGTFSTGYGGITFDSVNGFVIKGNPAIGLSITYDTLMVRADDEPDAVYGLIAESIEYPADRSWAAFALRPEARFRDGSPVTAEDVKFSFDVLLEKGHPQYAVLLNGVTGATVEGERRIRFDFAPDTPKRDMPMTVASLPVLQKAWFETRDFAEATLEPIMTSGPYEIDAAALSPGRSITYRRRADYWGWDVPAMRGFWHFDAIRFEYFRDRSAQFEAFKAGSFSFNEEFWSKLWATGYDFPAVNRGDILRSELPDERPAGTQGYWFNLRREKFQDPRVRQAIAETFDFEWSNRTLFFDLYTRTDSFFEGGPMQAEGKPTPEELAVLEPLADILPPGVLDDPAYVPPVTDGSGRNRRNLRRAARLLDEAGWKVDGDVRRNAAGEPLEIEFLSDSPSFDRITIPYTEQLQRIGVKATARRVDAAQYKRREDDYDFDIIVDRKGMSSTPGVELRAYFHSASAEAKGTQNLSGVSDPAVDALIEVITKAENRETLTAAVRALDRVLRAMHIWIPQWSKAKHTLAYWDIYGVPDPATKPKYNRGVIDRWWFDAEKAARFGDKFTG